MELETKFFVGCFAAYVFSFLAHCVAAALTRPGFYKTGRFLCFAGAILATIGLLFRWKAAGHPPLSNMYESMFTMSTLFAWVALGFTWKEPFALIEAGASAISVLMIGTASVFTSEVRPLVPALQSYWLHLHVSIAFVGEACFALAFILGYFFCARRLVEGAGEKKDGTIEDLEGFEKFLCVLVVYGMPIGFLGLLGYVLNRLSANVHDKPQYQSLLYYLVIPTTVFTGMFFLSLLIFGNTLRKIADRLLPSLDRLDNLIYRAISLGYPLYTVGALIFGMVWANKAWGRYWGWDPKETWALITFLVYSGYLHLRLTKGWKGTKTAALAVFGFIFTMFTLFGVNLVLSGLHSYASQ